MIDAKKEALHQALVYHNSMFGILPQEGKLMKRPSAEQIVATAKTFETFLHGQKNKSV